MSMNAVKSKQILRIFLILLIITAMIMSSPSGIMQVSADTITTTVSVGSSPMGVAVNSSSHKVYVTNNNTNIVTIIDGQTNNVITTLPVGNGPKGVAVDETDNLVYVANYAGSSLTVINGATNIVSNTVSVSAFPQAVAWNQSNNRIYVAHSYMDGLVTVIDASTGTVLSTITVGAYPSAIAANSVTNKIYVAHENGTVTVIDGSTNSTTTLTAGMTPESIAVDKTTNKIYVANSGSSTVSVINGSDNSVATIAITANSNPWGIAVNENTHKIYVANQSDKGVTVIDGNTNTVVQSLSIANYGTGIAVAVDKILNKIYVATFNSTNNLTVIDGSVIEAAGITGLTAPSVGAAPETVSGLSSGDSRYSVTGLSWENLGGTSATLDGSGNFTNTGNLYQARIELTAGADYKFPADGLVPTVNAGLPKAGLVSGGDVLGKKLTFVVTFPVDITVASLSGMVPPVAGATPIDASSLTPGNSSQYTVTSITWEDTGNTPIGAGAFPFGGAFIQARIVLTSQDGYKFPAGGLTPDVDGDGTAAEGTVGGGDVSGNALTFVTTFSDEIYSYQANISGLNPPAAGATPQTAGDLVVSYSGQYCTVSALTWKNSDGSAATLSGGKFVSGGSTYKAVIELMSQPGYKFPLAGFAPTVEDEGIYVSGAVTGGYVSGNKLTIEIAFSNEITSAGITGLVAPVKGTVPVTYGALTVGNPTQYNVGHMVWLNSDNTPATLTDGKFNAGSTYKVAIFLNSDTGYKFPLSGLIPSVNVGTPSEGEADYYVSGNSLGFTVTFPATASDTAYTAVNSITGVPVTGTAGAEIDLTGATVNPSGATNNTISWTVKSAGTTGVTNADLATGKFIPSGAGTLVLTATVTNGLTESTDYIQDFTITVSTTPATTYTITASAGSGGSITPSGSVYVVENDSQVFDITPASSSYKIASVTVDSVDQGAVSTYTFSNVMGDHTINATFSIVSSDSGNHSSSGGRATKSETTEITTTVSGNTATVNIPKAALEQAASGKDGLKLSTPVASLSFDTAALSTIFGKTAGDVKIIAIKVDAASLSTETQQLIGDRPVFNFSVTSGNNTVSQFGGNVTVSVPYTPKAGEDADAIVIHYINSEGKPEAVPNCKYDPATKTVTFTTNHFSKYAVGYNKVSFGDVKAGAWYENAVDFTAARGIVTGTGNGNFSPDGKLTRGQLLVMLMRAYGIDPDTNLSNNFSDAGNTYYTGYLAAAKRLGITEGLGNNQYAPNKQITRQEMFTLLYNTLKVNGELPEGAEKANGALTGYSDADSVASWAKDPAGALANAGIVGGSNGKLSPKNTTTRAEMAQVLYNLLSK